MTHPVHPAVLLRYRRMREHHRAIGVPGSLTAEREVQAIDPEGLLSLAEEVGAERARRLMEAERKRIEGLDQGWRMSSGMPA